MAHFNLYCTEDAWDDEEDYQQESLSRHNQSFHLQNPLCISFTEDQMYWEHNELNTLSSKEKIQKDLGLDYLESLRSNHPLFSARRDAVQWLLSVSAHFGFTSQTAVLSVFYLDHFLSMQQLQMEKPWVPQLAAVTCLSLAAKVEETRIPFLLDLQVEDTKYLFEAKTIKRMELLVLSALEWKMHPVTPLSFIDHIVRRLGFSTSQHWEFFRRCEKLLLSLIIDLRFVYYKPSVVASATMIHVINELDRFNAMEYEKELLGVMEMNMDEVKGCLELIDDLVMMTTQKNKPLPSPPGSPTGVFDLSLNSDGTNDSWASSSSSAVELRETVVKRRRLEDPQLRFSPFNQVVVDVLRSP